MVGNACGLPSSAGAYSLNVTVVPRGPLSYLSAWPTGQTQPGVSTLNAPTGTTTANAAILPGGQNGNISVFATGDTDLIIDTNGYFGPASAGGLSLYTVPPCRAGDSRFPVGSQPVTGDRTVNLADAPCGIPSGSEAVVLNATVVPSGGLSYLTLWPNGQPQPVVSTLNATDGTVTSNMALVPLSGGALKSWATSSTHLILDVAGYFAP